MTWRPLAIHWDPAALGTWYCLPMRFAKRIDAAVEDFARTGEGQLEWDAPHHLLRAGKHDVVLAIDLVARTVAVLQIYRARP